MAGAGLAVGRPVAMGSESSRDHSFQEPKYMRTFSKPACLSAKNELEARAPLKQYRYTASVGWIPAVAHSARTSSGDLNTGPWLEGFMKRYHSTHLAPGSRPLRGAKSLP